jgi:hypothetical protein
MSKTDIVGPTSTAGAGQSTSNFAATDPRRLDAKVGSTRPAQNLNGGDRKSYPAIDVNSIKRNGQKDLRTKILVPQSYFSQLTSGYNSALSNLRGIIFPYTPQIQFNHKADYSTQSPLHSNYAISFYKYSAVSDISITGVFTVQSVADAVNYLATVHLLRGLTKGRFGASDPLRGSPPPVCRLFAYGTFMFENVPVAVTSFKNDLGSETDYFYLKDSFYGEAAVPVRSNIVLECKPMYSRQEMLDATVPDWIKNKTQRSSGLL